MNPAPIPVYPSSRLIGLELEIDPGSTGAAPPASVQGWNRHRDGSLSQNGSEFVLDPPLTLEDAKSVVQGFATVMSKVNTLKAGGFHVHVQTPDDVRPAKIAAAVAKIYTHFQTQINRLLGKSRHNNRYCPPFSSCPSETTLTNEFQLNEQARNRADAKCSRAYRTVNFAMLRCVTPAHRTIEFRQGSVTKRYECIIGWAAFCVALVEISFNEELVAKVLNSSASWKNLVNMVRTHQELVGATNIAEWLEWRREYMEAKPTEAQLKAAAEILGTKPHGVFFVSRKLDINLPLTEKILQELTDRGLAAKIGLKFRSTAGRPIMEDLAELEAAQLQRELSEGVARISQVISSAT